MVFTQLARRALGAIEPLACQAFFVSEVAAEFEAIGLSLADGYHTARAAPMGAVHPVAVEAAFFSFNPRIVHRNVRFDLVTPEQAIAARQRGAGASLRRLVGERDLTKAAAGLRSAVEAAPVLGRPLFAGHRALPWPEDPYEAVWHGANAMREFRGDGHNALLLTHGLLGLEAQVLHGAEMGIEEPTKSFLIRGHGWKPDDYAAAVERLAARGLVTPEGQATDAGLKIRAMLERDTDHLAEAPWQALGEETTLELLEELSELSRLVLRDPTLPRLNAGPDPVPAS